MIGDIIEIERAKRYTIQTSKPEACPAREGDMMNEAHTLSVDKSDTAGSFLAKWLGLCLYQGREPT